MYLSNLKFEDEYTQYHWRPVTLRLFAKFAGLSVTYNNNRLGKAREINTKQGATVQIVSIKFSSVRKREEPLFMIKNPIRKMTAIAINTIIRWEKSLNLTMFSLTIELESKKYKFKEY